MRKTRAPERVVSAILTMRGQRVLLDSELAALYGVSTSRFNEQVRSNRKRFPADFMFQLTAEETRLDKKLSVHDDAIAAILSAIRELMNPTAPKRRGIGFTATLDQDK